MTNYTLFTKIMRNLFGISNKDVRAVIRLLQSKQIDSIQDQQINKRLDSTTISHLNQALTNTSVSDNNKTDDKQKTNEGWSLIKEVMVDLNLDDPNTATQQTRQLARQAKTNPRRLAQQTQQQAQAEKKAAMQASGPKANIQRQIADLKLKLATLQKRLQSMGGINEDYDIVVENEDGTIFEIEDILTESAIRQYKRFGNDLRIRYRCTSGQRTGTIVSSPASCAQRKDPVRVRTGKKTMRSKKAVIKRKSLISRKKIISKTLSRINKKLSGDT